MKLILCLFSVFLISANWMSNTDLGKAKSGQGVYQVYQSNSLCEKEENGQCWQIDNCSPVFCVPQPEQVDNLTKPIFGPKQNRTDCTNAQTCQILIRDGLCRDLANTQPGFEQKPGPGAGFEAYCRVVIGFQPKTIIVLKENAGMKAAFEASESQKELDDAARKNRSDVAKDDIKSFDPNDVSDDNLRRAMKLLKDLLE